MVLQALIDALFLSAVVLYYGSEGMSIACQPGLHNVSMVSCSNIPISANECLSLGCCWNDTLDRNMTGQCFKMSTNVSTKTTTLPVTTTHALQATALTPRPTSSFTKRDGFCVVYNRQACKKWLNLTKSEESHPARFIDKHMGINMTEFMLSQFMEVINNNVDEEQEECKNLLIIILCQYTFPPCDKYGNPKPYCREDCDATFKKCEMALTKILAVAKYILDKSGVKFAHMGIPNCTEHTYSYDMAVNKTCEHFGLFDLKKNYKPKPKNSIWFLALYAGIGGFIILVAIIFITSFMIRRRRNKKKRACKRVTFAAVTMRDRLRAETMLALDETKLLSNYNPDDIIQFPLDRVAYVKDLGEGNFGQVFQGRCFGLRPSDKPNTELMVAVKTLKSGCSKEMKLCFLQEVTLMSVLHHENIVELLAVSTEEEPYGMIFEFMAHGDLNQFLRKHGPYVLSENETKEDKGEVLTREDLLSIALQVANGMEYLQNMRFVHRDLATRNCLVGENLTIKIADFGMSRDVYASDYYKVHWKMLLKHVPTTSFHVPPTRWVLLRAPLSGTHGPYSVVIVSQVEGQAVMPIRWSPPEALLYGKFTVESDIYSYGVVLWEIYTYALQPYYGYSNEEVLKFIKKGVNLGIPDNCEPHIYDVMKSCWNRDALLRPKYEKIKAQLRNEFQSADVPSETPIPSTLHNPLYMNTLLKDQEAKQRSGDSSLSKLHKGQENACVPTSTGYMNVGCKAGDVDHKESTKENNTQLEEEEQTI